MPTTDAIDIKTCLAELIRELGFAVTHQAADLHELAEGVDRG
jgi:hypothetical protein